MCARPRVLFTYMDLQELIGLRGEGLWWDGCPRPGQVLVGGPDRLKTLTWISKIYYDRMGGYTSIE